MDSHEHRVMERGLVARGWAIEPKSNDLWVLQTYRLFPLWHGGERSKFPSFDLRSALHASKQSEHLLISFSREEVAKFVGPYQSEAYQFCHYYGLGEFYDKMDTVAGYEQSHLKAAAAKRPLDANKVWSEVKAACG